MVSAGEFGETVDRVGICDECGNLGVLHDTGGWVICQSCYDLAEDTGSEE